MEAMLFLAVIFTAVQMLSASSVPYLCVQGEFYNSDVMDCVKCSDCPANQVPLRACWKNQDTLCGTLGKFQFRQPPFRQQPVRSSENVRPDTDITNLLPVPHQTTVEVAEDVSGDRWFTITMVLVGILVFMCILGVVLLFITCYVCKKTKRDVVCDPVFTSSLLKPDEQTGIRQIEQLKLVVTETLTISSRQWGYGIDRRLVQCENLRELAVMRRAPHDAFNAVTVILKWRISNSHLHVKM